MININIYYILINNFCYYTFILKILLLLIHNILCLTSEIIHKQPKNSIQ